MRIFHYTLLTIGLICFLSCFEKEEYTPKYFGPNSPHGNQLSSHFKALNWRENLAIKDIELIRSIVDSTGRHWYGENNLIVPLLIHREYSIQFSNSLSHSDFYQDYFLKTKNLTDEEFDNYLLKKIKPETLEKLVDVKTSHYHSYSDDLLNILIVRQCKLLRKGLPSNIEFEDRMLNSYQKSLLLYSTLSEKEAINELYIDLLNPGSVLTYDKYAPLNTISSYGREATLKSIKILKDTSNFKTIENYGKVLLFSHVYRRIKYDLTKSEQKEVLSFLNKKEIFGGVLEDFRFRIGLLTHEITEKSMETCLNDVGLFKEEESNKWNLKSKN